MEEIIPVGRDNVSPQAPLTEVITTSETTSGVDELCARDFYNLRGVDDDAKARKKQQLRAREERIQNRRLKKQRKIREAEATVERALKLREKLRQNRLDFEESVKGREEEFYYIPQWRRAVPLDKVKEPWPDFEWISNHPTDEFGIFDLKHISWRVEELTLQLAKSTVGLESYSGSKHLFSCSGTTVEYLMGIGYVVTSASLVKWPHQDKQADQLKIDVHLPSGEVLEGSVSNVDFSYNICVIEVPSTVQLPTRSFSADTRIFNFYERHSKDVVALGRLCKPWSLNASFGKLVPKRSQFDCEELLVSSCRISKRGVGGPLMDFDGNIIGMNFYDKKETPFLPGFIVLKCLQHFNDFKKVIRPLHGLRVRTLHEDEQLTALEKIHHEFPEIRGVIVEKVEVPSAEHSEIQVGDIITHVNDVPFSSAAELGGMLLDTCSQHMLERQKLDPTKDGNQMETVISLKFDVKTVRGRRSEATTRTIDVGRFTPTSGFNRWPLGRPYLIRWVKDGTLFTEKQRG